MTYLTTTLNTLIVSIKSGSEARCPVCGSLFIEELWGDAGVTCRDRRHPKGDIRIKFQVN